MRPGRFTSLVPQCLRPFLIAQKTFVKSPGAILPSPAICHTRSVSMSTMSHSPIGHIAVTLVDRVQECRSLSGQSYRSHSSYYSHHSSVPMLHRHSPFHRPFTAHSLLLSQTPANQHVDRFVPLLPAFQPTTQTPANQPLDRIVPLLSALVVRLAVFQPKSLRFNGCCRRNTRHNPAHLAGCGRGIIGLNFLGWTLRSSA